MLITSQTANFFRLNLLEWHRQINDRAMPWKGEADPYRIWLSEIILQQTRVQQGLPYYNRFIEKYPSVTDLANADDSEVYKLWEGLGYYSRCRNLLHAARRIRDQYGGIFPTKYTTIRELKGVGEYTAAAISSFAFRHPIAVVDGNVQRVLARVFEIYTETGSTEGKKLFTDVANQLLYKDDPAEYNQAIMDFGATVCKPKLPECMICPLQNECRAFHHNTIHLLPVKKQAAVKKLRHFYYLILSYDDKIYVRRRTGKDIWQDLYEFVLVETEAKLTLTPHAVAANLTIPDGATIVNISEERKQVLTHQILYAQFLNVQLARPLPEENDYQLVDAKRMSALPFPKLIVEYLKEKKTYL